MNICIVANATHKVPLGTQEVKSNLTIKFRNLSHK